MAVWRREAGAVVDPNYYLLAPNTVFRLPADSVLRPESTLYNGIPDAWAARVLPLRLGPLPTTATTQERADHALLTAHRDYRK